MLIPCKQGSAEWLQLRVARVTGSRCDAVMSMLKKGGSSAERKNYMAELIAETLTGIATEHYVSPYMDWGTQYEAEARGCYEIQTGHIVDLCGFFVHDAIPRFGASPDGLVGTDGLVEFKCPKTETHIRYIQEGVVPPEYAWQITAELACTGRQWCDFASYDPRLPDALQLFTVRMMRDEAKIAELESGVLTFLEEAIATIDGLREKMGAFKPKPRPAVDTRTDEEHKEKPKSDGWITDEEIEWAMKGFTE